MAYVNVAEWKPDQVTEWLKGLDVAILPYVHSFLNNRVTGQQLLGFGPNDLEHLGIRRIGHQEIILEGVEHLRNIHYELDRENLQLLAMRLSCQTHSLHNELCHSHANLQRLSTQILADIANIVSCVKPLIAWLDRPGFSGQAEYTQTRSEVLRLALAMATCGQRDRFAEAPVTEMKDASARLAKLCDAIVQEMTDPLILQPASLDLATVKKRSSDDLGFYIVPSFRGAHQISDLKLNSPAHQCGKIEPGDEIIQINYQTVVGWGVKEVMHLFAESPTEILLTLKKRPKHTKVYGQIYVKPYRLPSKKRAIHSHAFTPRPDLLTRLQFRLPVPLHTLKLPTVGKIESPREHRDSSSSEEEEVTVQHKLAVPSKPVHRRATITGASPLSKRPPLDIHELWHNLKLEKDSCPKQSTSSVVDFEERVSSASKNGASSVTVSGDHESNLEMLSIKQKIQMFSRDHTNKLEKQKVVPKKQQLRINSEPIFDGRNISEAVIMFMKKPSDLNESNKKSSINENVETVASKQPVRKEPVSLPVNLESLPCSEPCTSSRHLPEPPKEIALPSKYYEQVGEEHGKVVETINRHILADTFGDEAEARDYRSYGNNLDSGKEVDKLGGLPVLGKKRYQSNLLAECDSELSRTISKVNTEDIINNKEQLSPSSLPYGLIHKNNFQVLPRRAEPPKITPKNTNLDKSFSNDSINRLPDARFQHHAKNESWSSSGVSDYDGSMAGSSRYNSLQDRHLRGSGAASKDCFDNVSAKSFPSSDFSERSPRAEAAPERQTLPKAGVKLTQHQPTSPSGGGGGPPVPPPRPSLSKPPNACYRAIMAARSLGKASPKAQRKKNTLIAKRREVTIKDFPVVDCEGWLLQRCRKGSGTWIKRWCLIHANTLYAFKTKQSDKAETMVCLPGFTVSPAEEVKSKQFAFKVYHTGTMFYFAAETNFELTVWLDAISTATLGPNPNSQDVVYSESEDEEKNEAFNTYGTSRKPVSPSAPTPSPRSPVSPPSTSSQGEGSLFGSLKKLGSRSSSNNSASNTSGGSSLDRKCLRILGSGPVPVPTAQYRSYRRVHNTPPAPPANNPTLTPTSSKDREHSEHHSPLPPEMADYRLASLTAKITPPVPRRRVVPVLTPTPPPSSSSSLDSRRPHISAPILNHPFQSFDDRTRRPLNAREPPNEYRNTTSSESSWMSSLKRADVRKKKIKSKKGFSPVTRTHHVHPSHHSEPQPSHAMGVGPSSTSALPPPDYPGLEYPPVFEPGTYTLDALSLLPRNVNARNQ